MYSAISRVKHFVSTKVNTANYTAKPYMWQGSMMSDAPRTEQDTARHSRRCGYRPEVLALCPAANLA
jgi:hypothetical protein